tara:strand:+ start:1141 stop:1521 length:381 start_codon:yes stop_codon:yes gene_type:complete
MACQAEPIDHPPTTVAPGGCATQRQRNGYANEKGEVPVSDASSRVGKEARSPIDLAKAVQKKRIGEVFDIDPDAVTTGDVLNEKSTFPCVIDGFLLNHKTALGLCTHERCEQLGMDVGEALFLIRF